MLSNTTLTLACVFVLLSLIQPATAFGAGSLPAESAFKHLGWRHGDIAEVLLQVPSSYITNYAFTELEKSQIYFGNWLRDYSQLLDISTLEHLSRDWLRTIVAVLGFLEFGYATGPFEVTNERLFCYRAEHHIDNPKGYGCDASGKYAGDDHIKSLDPRLRLSAWPQELEIDHKTGMKRYIHDRNGGFASSTGFIHDQLKACIEGYRNASGDKSQRDEAYIHLGAALHTLEDFLAHSNYVELALQSYVHETAVYDYVGQDAKIRAPDSTMVAPLVTGTFGSTDLYHSLLGELRDKLMTTTKEASDTLGIDHGDHKLIIGNLFGALGKSLGAFMLISGLGSTTHSVNTCMQTTNDHIENRKSYKPDDLKSDTVANELWGVIKPLFELHDNIMLWIKEREDELSFITEPINKIKETVSQLVWSVLTLVLTPVIDLLETTITKAENAVIGKSETNDTRSTDPSHTDICKDHLENMLNCVAGRVATTVTSFAVHQVVTAWDDEHIKVEDAIDPVLEVLHHPKFPNAQPLSIIQSRMLTGVFDWATATRFNSDLHFDSLQKSSIDAGHNKSPDMPTLQAPNMKGFSLYRDWHVVKKPPPEIVPDWVKNALHQAAIGMTAALDWTTRNINSAEKAIDHVAHEVFYGAFGILQHALPLNAQMTVALCVGGPAALIGLGVVGLAQSLVDAINQNNPFIERVRLPLTVQLMKEELGMREKGARDGMDPHQVEQDVRELYTKTPTGTDEEKKEVMERAAERGERVQLYFEYGGERRRYFERN